MPKLAVLVHSSQIYKKDNIFMNPRYTPESLKKASKELNLRLREMQNNSELTTEKFQELFGMRVSQELINENIISVKFKGEEVSVHFDRKKDFTFINGEWIHKNEQ
jgi:transcriptional regulator of heat shock response